MLTLRKLESLPTLTQGHTDDLKLESATSRVWLSRLTKEDGMPYDNQVTEEQLINGKWVTVRQYQAK